MIRKNKCQLAVVEETTEGSAETIAAGDVFLAHNVSFSPDIEANKRAPMKNTMGATPSVMGKRKATMAFDVELVGQSAAGVAVHFVSALKACAVLSTVVADTSVAYTPTSLLANTPSVTIGMYEDGKLHQIWGARGTAKLSLEGGKPAMIHFEFTGADWSETDVAMFTSGVTLNALIPPVFLDASFLINSYAAKISKLEIDFGNVVTLRSDLSTASGYISAMITDREAKMTFDPEDVLEADEGFFSIWRAGTTMAMSASIGSVTGNTFAISGPAVQYQGISKGERESLGILNINALMCETATGDDDWQILNT